MVDDGWFWLIQTWVVGTYRYIGWLIWIRLIDFARFEPSGGPGDTGKLTQDNAPI